MATALSGGSDLGSQRSTTLGHVRVSARTISAASPIATPPFGRMLVPFRSGLSWAAVGPSVARSASVNGESYEGPMGSRSMTRDGGRETASPRGASTLSRWSVSDQRATTDR